MCVAFAIMSVRHTHVMPKQFKTSKFALHHTIEQGR